MSANEQAVTNKRKPVLELSDVTSAIGEAKSIRLSNFTGQLFEGDVVQVRLGAHHDPRDLLSLVLGLGTPLAGRIQFAGKDWLGRNYRQHYQMRSQIGRIFASAAWVQSLTVGENIRLAQLHHGVGASIITDRITYWTERLSGRHLSTVRRSFAHRPTFVDDPILQICQWIRAVCNQPKLLLFDRPFRFITQDLHLAFVSVIDELANKGASVLWFSSGHEEFHLQIESRLVQWSVPGDVLQACEVPLNHE